MGDTPQTSRQREHHEQIQGGQNAQSNNKFMGLTGNLSN